jgi:hypothetical protein
MILGYPISIPLLLDIVKLNQPLGEMSHDAIEISAMKAYPPLLVSLRCFVIASLNPSLDKLYLP